MLLAKNYNGALRSVNAIVQNIVHSFYSHGKNGIFDDVSITKRYANIGGNFCNFLSKVEYQDDSFQKL